MKEYLHRFYREHMLAEGLVSFRAAVAESDLFIWAERELQEAAVTSLSRHRRDLEGFIDRHPLFRTTMRPYDVPAGSPEVVTLMAGASERAGVGPMAAVAGALAGLVGRDLQPLSHEIIVENGGDIYLRSSRERRVGVFAGESPLSGKIALKVPATAPQGLGVCTSSGTVGPSRSAGKADTALVIAAGPALADAAATAMGNRVKDPSHVEGALAWAMGIKGVLGCLVIIEEHLGIQGDIILERP
jgi:ApbE superfamily uncharacterized protein (UPF0280 family)